MKTRGALSVVLASSAALWECAEAFTPSSSSSSSSAPLSTATAGTTAVTTSALSNTPSSSCSSTRLFNSFLGMDDEDEDDDDEEDDDLELSSSSYSSSSSAVKSPFTGLTLDPWDPHPLIKPRPSRFFKKEDYQAQRTPDDQLVQTLTETERGENLTVLRQIRNQDLPDLRRRKDHAGWVEANNDLKQRLARDPWFEINERLKNAIQLGQDDATISKLQDLAQSVGGPPPGIDDSALIKGYAAHTEIYDIKLSPARSAALLERKIREERSARGRAMMKERQKNQELEQQRYEQDMRNPGVRQDQEAKERRERTMRRLMQEIEADNEKAKERAKEILGQLPETPETRTQSMQEALAAAREEVKKIRRQQLGQAAEDTDEEEDDDDEEDRPKSGADKAREAATAEASGGRPRLPGDKDVTRGEVPEAAVESSSTTTTGPLQVQVTSRYNQEQSDPPMRKHCFQYTIRITNHSPTDTIQLLGRRFEIQTVGSSMKDVVQGEGVTGRTPVLAPGEVFEYTSTAPLSVRPIGTTIIAARMKGEYRYVTLEPGQTTASPEQLEQAKPETAKLGTFHFVFPEEQRVKPFRAQDAADDDDDEEDDDDEDEDEKPSLRAVAPKQASKAAVPASSLPGDADIQSGKIAVSPLNDGSDVVTDQVRVQVSTSYRPERSDDLQDKHCFAYNIRITNTNPSQAIQLVSRRFEIQTVGSPNKDIVQGPGVTGRQPILQPGESFEYTSTAPLSVKPLLDKTPVVARMQGEYNFVLLDKDNSTPVSSTPLQAKLGMFHFILPAMT